MRHGGSPFLRVPQMLCSSPPQDFLPPPQGDLQATRKKVLLWQGPQGLSLGALSSFHPTPSGCPFPELQDQCLFPDEGTAGLVFLEGSRSSLQFQKQKARLSPIYVQYSGPTHHQLHLTGKTKQNVGSYVHGTKTRATVQAHQGHLPGFNFVRSCDEHGKLLGLQAALWGRETSSPLQVWKLRLGERQPLQAGGSRPQLRQPRAQAQLSPPWDVCSSPADLSFPTRGPDSALGAPHPPCLRPPHAEPSAFSIPSSSPSIPPLLPFPWQPHPPLCHSVLCFHLSSHFHLFPHGSV